MAISNLSKLLVSLGNIFFNIEIISVVQLFNYSFKIACAKQIKPNPKV